MKSETIAALATAPGVGAVSVIRVSGEEAFTVISRCFSRSRVLLEGPRRAVLGTIFDDASQRIDEVLATAFPAPASYTGEEVIEISGHGGLFVTQRVLKRLYACGARPAEPGEFTQRAFLNGKMDLTQAEGVMDIISAQSDLALRAAQNQLQGSILKVTTQIRDALIATTAHLEAYIDFPEEDIDPESSAHLVDRLQSILSACHSLLATSETGKLLREGARVVICGQPNAGKSSLLNGLLGYDRAIVNERAGTTRDTVEEVIQMAGLPVRLIDTAGLRETAEEVERAGIQRAKVQIESADLVIELVDGSQPKASWQPAQAPSALPMVRLLNKADLGIDPSWGTQEITVSSHQEEDLKQVCQLIAQHLLGGQSLTGSALVAINGRHQSCLRRVEAASREAQEGLQAGRDPEIISLALRDAMEAIGELSGRVDPEDILGAIFAQFCIGK